MKTRFVFVVVATMSGALAALASACVGDSTTPADAGDSSLADNAVSDSPSGDGEGSAPDAGPAMYGRFAYVANDADGTITTYAVDGARGWLRLGNYALAGKGGRLAIDPSGKHLYEASSDGNVTSFTIAPDGSLPFSGSTKAIGGVPASIAIEPTGHYAYVVSSGAVFQFSIDGTGALTALAPASVPTGPATLAHALAIDASGKHAYVSANDGLVYEYAIAGDGKLSALSSASITGGAGTQAIALDPSGKHAYVTAQTDNAIYQYSIGADGTLTALSPSKVATGGGPRAPVVDPSGRFVFVANHDDSTVSQYAIGASGVLTALAPASAATGTNPIGVTVDGSGQFAYTENATDDTVTQLAIGSGGGLVATRTIRTRDKPTAFVMTSGTTALAYKVLFAYASSYYADDAGNNIGQYTIGATGTLNGVGVAPAAGNAGRFIATNPAGSYLYVSNLLGASIAQYSVGSTGTLTALNPTYALTGTGPIGLVIDPNGRFAYDVNYYSNNLSAFSISSGKLTAAGSPAATGSSPVCLSIDPTGRFMYASNTDSSATNSPGPNASISSYALADPTTGAITVGTTYTLTNKAIWCVNVDPTGRFAYAATNLTSAALIYQYKIDTAGALVALSPPTVATGNGAGLVAFDPYGHYAYAINGTDNTVSQYTINSDGTLQAMSPAVVSTGKGPSAITVDFSGQHAYVTNSSDNTISQYSVGATGALSQLTPATIGDYAGNYPTSITTTGAIQ